MQLTAICVEIIPSQRNKAYGNCVQWRVPPRPAFQQFCMICLFPMNAKISMTVVILIKMNYDVALIIIVMI